MASTDTDQDKLQTVSNQLAAEGHSFPQVKLKDGTMIQTGTIGGLLSNIKRYNTGDKAVEEDMRAAVPTAVRAGLFDLFPPAEWASDNNPGRALVGRFAADYISKK